MKGRVIIMLSTPRGERLNIALFGKRNTGKSSLINALSNQDIALVSSHAGTTTDPVSKAMEILPIGPVMITDTAGLDDHGELGELRIKKTLEVLNTTETALIVVESESKFGSFEEDLLKQIKNKDIPVIGIINKIDVNDIKSDKLKTLSKKYSIPFIAVSTITGEGIEELKKKIIFQAPEKNKQLGIVNDLIKPHDFVVLVTPIDKAAPKGRLILPQQQVIRDVIDNNAMAIVTKESSLKETLSGLKQSPSLVITDSQVVGKVAEDVPHKTPLTTFSILFARYKGELDQLAKGVTALKHLKPGANVLISEGCTHHRQNDDIGTVKIPRWLKEHVGIDINLSWSSGGSFSNDIKGYDLIIHCGGCMLHKKEMDYRLRMAAANDVPIINYGVFIAFVHGVLDRALEPFE